MSIDRVIISGGGTGGHIFPALAIAEGIKAQNPAVQILFVGALGRMEMEKIPLAGYEIKGLNIVGFNRKNMLKNLILPIRLTQSIVGAYRILKAFKPQLVVGVGGYASGPTLKVANWLKYPTLIQEQNSFPGKTNLLLAKKAAAICVAYTGMEKYFPENKIHLTGNPVRSDLVSAENKKNEAYAFYQLDPSKKTILVIGGSLGARSINEAMVSILKNYKPEDAVQVIWQCGKGYIEEYKQCEFSVPVKVLAFIERMDYAYSIADVVVSRAGATSVSELSIIGKPSILVPSPNVSEDHQTKNALALSSVGAAVLVEDNRLLIDLLPAIEKILGNSDFAGELSKEIRNLGKPKATDDIVLICNKIVQS